MDFYYVTDIGKLTDEQRLRFYELFAHKLTISVRGVWSNDALSDAEKVEGMKFINEILHRIIPKAAFLRLDQNKHTEKDTWEIIQHYVTICPLIEGDVGWAIMASFNYASSQ